MGIRKIFVFFLLPGQFWFSCIAHVGYDYLYKKTKKQKTKIKNDTQNEGSEGRPTPLEAGC